MMGGSRRGCRLLVLFRAGGLGVGGGFEVRVAGVREEDGG